MRFLIRIALADRVTQTLQFYQNILDNVLANDITREERSRKIDATWKNHRKALALEAVEVALKAMASGRERCMYCEDSHGGQIEHFRPKAHYPKQMFDWPNLLLICGDCNTQKNDEFDDQMLDPTSDDPLDFLVLAFTEGRFRPRKNSTRGARTLTKLKRFAFDEVLIEGRRNAFQKLRIFLRLYPQLDTKKRVELRHIVVNEPFSSVFAAVLRSSRSRNAEAVLGKGLIDTLSQHPDIYGWLHEADALRRSKAQADLDEIAQRIRVGTANDER